MNNSIIVKMKMANARQKRVEEPEPQMLCLIRYKSLDKLLRGLSQESFLRVLRFFDRLPKQVILENQVVK
jgi:hypothetical protein